MAFTDSPAPLDDPAPVRLVVLAGRRADAPDALAERFGVSHRCLVPLAGRPLIAHVLATASAHPRVASLAVVIERKAFEGLWDVLTGLPGRGNVALIEARDDLAESVCAASIGWAGPLVVTTGDHALLSLEAIDAVLAGLPGADVVLPLAPDAMVARCHRVATAFALPFHDGAMAPCPLYGLAGADAARAADLLRGPGALAHGSRQLARLLGAFGLARLVLRRMSLHEAELRVSGRSGLRVRAVTLGDGRQALRVGDERGHAIARDLVESDRLERGSGIAAPWVCREAAA